MKTFISLSAIVTLLGACASTPSSPAPGTTVEAATSYTVTQNGVDHVLADTAPRSIINDGRPFYLWSGAGGTPRGYAARTSQAGTGIAAGLDNGTYFAGVSGPFVATIPVSGIANYSGAYGFIVNGVDLHGPLVLTADFTSGSIVDGTAGIDVRATITGKSIDGTVSLAGETGTLAGGFYNRIGVTTLAGAAVGANMAGIISAQ